MRSYDQYCAAARALDVVGDRWTLLIVRELLLRQPCRYTDLRQGLPGIATNLLADRLREMEANGIVTREVAAPPVATTLVRLTPRGEALRRVIQTLGEWGEPLLRETPPGAAFRTYWLALPLERYLTDHEPDRPPVTIEVRTGDDPVLVQTAEGGAVRVRPGVAPDADATIQGSPRLVFELLMGQVELAEARKKGLEYQGDPAVLRRVQRVAVDDVA
jgi:DNA-binding HxlR family transcriptional regulator